jgi:hypothetical protein
LRDEKSLWPLWLAGDIDGLTVWSVGYVAPVSRWTGTATHIVDRAENILGRLLTQPELLARVACDVIVPRRWRAPTCGGSTELDGRQNIRWHRDDSGIIQTDH